MTDTVHAFDLTDGWCHAHRAYCDMTRTYRAPTPDLAPDQHGNRLAHEGASRCFCGCKYWEYDRCVDCGTTAAEVLRHCEDCGVAEGETHLPHCLAGAR